MLACRNPAWRLITTRVVVPWVFRDVVLTGDVLETLAEFGFADVQVVCGLAGAVVRFHATLRSD